MDEKDMNCFYCGKHVGITDLTKCPHCGARNYDIEWSLP